MDAAMSGTGEVNVFLDALNASLRAADIQHLDSHRQAPISPDYQARRLRALRYEKVTLQLEVRRLRVEFATAAQQVEDCNARIAELAGLLKTLQASRTWRVTHFLRTIPGKLRRQAHRAW